MAKKRILILGAAGRDFHNFNVVFRGDASVEVVAFTATQIPRIDGRMYPPELAGPLYPKGIPIRSENDLVTLIRELAVDEAVFAYSDVSHETVMHKASAVVGAGAAFTLLGGNRTMLRSKKPVVAVCAVRTGSGKSQTTRRVSEILKAKGRRVVVVRHPMPYGDLVKQRVQRFAAYADLDRHECTIEEREEYEPHIDMGNVVYAGVDYGDILAEAEKEADVILWDGGNNDTSFYKPDLLITVVDPHRAGHEVAYHPGEINLRTADVVVINKMDTAPAEGIGTVRRNIQSANPGATVIEAASPLTVERPEAIKGKRVLVIEDGPTLTHGEMPYGAGVIAAKKFGAAEIVDPRPWAAGLIREVYEKYPKIGTLLPAMGYGEEQVRDLEATVAAADCDSVVIGTPIDLSRVMRIDKPSARVRYRLQEIGTPTLDQVLGKF
ncbi:MAG: cyclic 2,3-diphosphoglycerate synthase [bacterium]|nr:cyclic 2,3-diphosphoglycerate synthase [bacterium]